MSFSLQRLLPLFERERTLHQPMVLATVVRSAGPTYAKPGAHMLLAGNGEYAGLVSGGYLEGDLAEHGRAVLAAAGRAQRAARLLLVVNSDDAAWPPGAAVSADDGEPFDTNAMATERVAAGGREAALAALRALAARLTQERCSHFLPQAVPGIDVLALSQPPAVQILLVGAGPRAPAGGATWGPAPSRAPAWAAAIIMSHHLATDLGYLRTLASSDIRYVGLLGSSVRCQRLLVDLGADAARRGARLRAPVGLDLGAAAPEAIALSIVA